MLPENIVPMEPVLEAAPPTGPSYVHSIKWDGVRELAFVSSRGISIQNRRLHDRTHAYPELHDALKHVSAKGLVLDGEVIALNKNARPSFHLVMRRDGVASADAARKMRSSLPVYYMVFDLLYYNGDSIMEEPLSRRLEMLAEVLPSETQTVQLVETEVEGQSLFRRTGELGLEGTVAKKINSRYVPGGKSRLWIKAKHQKKQNAVVGGFVTAGGRLKSLSVGAYSGESLLFLGNVSTGLSGDDLPSLGSELSRLEQQHSPFANLQRKAAGQHWVVPVLTLKVKYLELTEDGHLRHPVVEGFLTAKAEECRLEE